MSEKSQSARYKHVHKDHGHILFAFVAICVVGKDLNISNWSSVADDTITQGGLGSPFDICGCSHLIHLTEMEKLEAVGILKI